MPAGRHIVVVEDDAAIRLGVVDALESEGFTISEAPDGPRGLELAVSVACDLVLLDLSMPGLDGLSVLTELRKSKPVLPVIILTARGDEADRVKGLRLGADDYVVKPFSLQELLARVEAVLRRSPERPTDLAKVALPDAGGEVDLARREVRFADGATSELSEKEAELLRYLAINPGRAISRDELLARVWGINPRGVTTRTIDMHVARLREKLRDSDGGALIRTVRGKGYMLAATGGAT